MTDLTTPVTADWLWQMAGPDMWLYKSADGHHMLQGKGARCVMTGAEYAKYQAMKGKWRAAGQDLAGAPMVSMLVVESEEEARRIAEERLEPKEEVMSCPHCHSGLLWSEDRGAHCDGCDDFDPEKDLPGVARTSDFARSFREIEDCLLAYTRCVKEDECDEIIRQLAGKVLPLKEAVLRAEEIWREENPDETLRVKGGPDAK